MEKTRPTVLVVEDDTAVVVIVRQILEGIGFEVASSRNGEGGVIAALRQRPTLILLDINLPDIDGLAVCARLKNDQRTKDIPVIFLTGTEVGIDQTFEAGGADYIRKPFSHAELIARVETHVALFQSMEQLQVMNARLERRVRQRTKELEALNQELEQQIDRRRRVEDQLAQLSTRDSLTHLRNRNAFFREMGLEQPRPEFTALVTIKVDRIGETNQAYGFAAGDEDICRVALALETVAHSDEPISRVGGVRFSMLLRRGSGAERANELIDVIADSPMASDTFGVDLNIGVVSLVPGLTTHEAIILADHACIKARDAGGNMVVELSDPSMKHVLESQSMKSAATIQERFAADGFTLLKQEIRDVKTNAVFGHEVFIRPPDVNRQAIDRREFQRHIARLRIRPQIDRWVLNRASMVAASSRCVIEITDPQPFDDEFWHLVASVVNAQQKHGGTIVFQLSEKLFRDRTGTLVRFAARAHETSCDIIISEFTGQGIDFSNLCLIPGTAVKLDTRFLGNLQSMETLKLVSAVADVALAAGFETIAEHVDEAKFIEPLVSAGVRYVQGDAVRKPEAADTFG